MKEEKNRKAAPTEKHELKSINKSTSYLIGMAFHNLGRLLPSPVELKKLRIRQILRGAGPISNKEIDENDTRWQPIKEFLGETWDEIAASGKSIDEFVTIAVDTLGSRGKPYFDKFVREEIDKKRRSSSKVS